MALSVTLHLKTYFNLFGVIWGHITKLMNNNGFHKWSNEFHMYNLIYQILKNNGHKGFSSLNQGIVGSNDMFSGLIPNVCPWFHN